MQAQKPIDFNMGSEPLRHPEPVSAGCKVGNHLKSHNDVTDCPIFPPGTKSLLSKYLDKNVWDALKNKKDKYGFSFQEAIFSGCKNVDSGIGVYSGSHESYYDFAPLMDKIIEDYHGHSQSDKHQAEGNSQLNAPDFPEDEAKMIKSTRIRVGRNLDGFPLGPAVSNQDRADIESKVTQALSSFDGELKGKYYSLDTMTP